MLTFSANENLSLRAWAHKNIRHTGFIYLHTGKHALLRLNEKHQTRKIPTLDISIWYCLYGHGSTHNAHYTLYFPHRNQWHSCSKLPLSVGQDMSSLAQKWLHSVHWRHVNHHNRLDCLQASAERRHHTALGKPWLQWHLVAGGGIQRVTIVSILLSLRQHCCLGWALESQQSCA